MALEHIYRVTQSLSDNDDIVENLKDEFKLQISPQKEKKALISFEKLIKNNVGTNEVGSLARKVLTNKDNI